MKKIVLSLFLTFIIGISCNLAQNFIGLTKAEIAERWKTSGINVKISLEGYNDTGHYYITYSDPDIPSMLDTYYFKNDLCFVWAQMFMDYSFLEMKLKFLNEIGVKTEKNKWIENTLQGDFIYVVSYEKAGFVIECRKL